MSISKERGNPVKVSLILVFIRKSTLFGSILTNTRQNVYACTGLSISGHFFSDNPVKVSREKQPIRTVWNYQSFQPKNNLVKELIRNKIGIFLNKSTFKACLVSRQDLSVPGKLREVVTAVIPEEFANPAHLL